MTAPETGSCTTPRAGWFVRAVALLLVAAGLQAGSFRDLDSAQDFYFGSADYSSAVLPETRKALVAKSAAHAALGEPVGAGANEVPSIAPIVARPIAPRAVTKPHALRAALGHSLPRPLLPDPTGPPRA